VSTAGSGITVMSSLTWFDDDDRNLVIMYTYEHDLFGDEMSVR